MEPTTTTMTSDAPVVAHSSGGFGEALLKALGLQGRSIAEVHIHAVAKDPVRIEIIENMLAPQGSEVVKVLHEYNLVPKVEGS